MYKPSEASQLLNIPESTLRRLAKQFSDYLSKHTGNRRYTERDLSILQQARDMLERGLTVRLVKGELEKIVSLLDEEAPAPAPEPEPDASPVMRQLAIINNQYSSLLSELERLRQEREGERARLEALERFLSLPWWKRLFQSPPR